MEFIYCFILVKLNIFLIWLLIAEIQINKYYLIPKPHSGHSD